MHKPTEAKKIVSSKLVDLLEENYRKLIQKLPNDRKSATN